MMGENSMFQKILVPLDGSPFGEHALPLALSLARRNRASVQVVHVHLPLPPMFVSEKPGQENHLESSLKQRSADYLEGVLTRLKSMPDVPVTATFLQGEIKDVLREHAIDSG